MNHNTQKRRDFVKTIGAGATLAFLSRCGLSAADKSQKKLPNILLVFADQHRNHAMGFKGQDPVLTPNLDRFADQSAVMENAISSYPLCSPFRSTLLTGRFPLSTGITTNTKPGLLLELDQEEVCLGDVWKSHGYQTCYVGKWHLDAPELTKNKTSASGATDWDAFTPPGPRRHGFDHWYAYNAFDDHFHPHYWRDTPEMIQVNNMWSPTHETNEVISFIKQRDKERPFAAIISWNPPHPPYVAPEEFLSLYDPESIPIRKNAHGVGENFKMGAQVRHQYYAAVSSCDHEFGKLLQTLKEEDIDQDTIVIYTADHGEMLGSHNHMSKNIWYEESINIPFMAYWPGKIKAHRSKALFASYDFMPTILGIMGLPIPGAVEGQNQAMEIFQGDQQGPDSVLLQRIGVPNDQPPVALGQEPSPYVVEAYKLGQKGVDWRQNWYRGIRTADYTYVVSKLQAAESTKRYLYDNLKNPYQLNPTVLSKDKAREFESELQVWLDKTKDSFSLV